VKLSPKTLVPVLAAFATIAFASPAFAWNSSICNPQTGQVLQGGGAPPLTTEAKYYAYLHDHPGSFEMSHGQVCKKQDDDDNDDHGHGHHPTPTPTHTATPTPTHTATPTPTATVPPTIVATEAPTVTPADATPTPEAAAPVVVAKDETPPAPIVPIAPVAPVAPVVVETALAPLIPVVTHDNRPMMCHYESTVGFSTPRRSNDLFKDLAKAGNTAIDANGQCDKPVAPVAPVAPAPIVVAGVQAVAPVTPVAAPVVPAPVAPSMPAVTAPPAPPITAAPVEPEIVPVVLEISVIAPPAAGDGTQADELAP